MSWAIRLTDVHDSEVTFVRLRNPWPGWWLAAYDPDALEGFGEARFVEEPADALRFGTFDEAKACWARQSSVLPERDGRPNRPLVICSISIDPVG